MLYAQKKVLNLQVFLEFMCDIVFAVLILYLVSSGKYLSYVTPKMAPYLYFTAAVMVVWAMAGLFRLFRPQHKTRVAHCSVLAIPIILLLLPHTPISTSDLSSGYLFRNTAARLPGQVSSSTPGSQSPSDGSETGAWASAPAEDGLIDDTTSTEYAAGSDGQSQAPDDTSADIQSDTQSDVQSDGSADTQSTPSGDVSGDTSGDSSGDVGTDEDAVNLPGLDTVNKKITVRDEDFGVWFNEIYINLEKYEGYQISMKGFVFRDPENMKDNEFVPARLMMSCCVADLSACGFICQYDGASKLKEDSWVTVEGTLHKGVYMEDEEPQITVTKITPAEKVEGYIYP